MTLSTTSYNFVHSVCTCVESVSRRLQVQTENLIMVSENDVQCLMPTRKITLRTLLTDAICIWHKVCGILLSYTSQDHTVRKHPIPGYDEIYGYHSRCLWHRQYIGSKFWYIDSRWRIYASVDWLIIGSDNSLSPGRRQAIIWINAGILLTGPLATNFNGILIKIYTLSFSEMHLLMSPAKWRPFCVGLSALIYSYIHIHWGCLSGTAAIVRLYRYREVTPNDIE